MDIYLGKYKKQLQQELKEILDYWIEFTPDHENGGFYGSVNNDNVPEKQAPKGVVLNARILWTFSAAFNYKQNKKWLLIARRAYEYINSYFVDREFGGVYWTVDYRGKKLNDRKQIYGIAFCIYALSEYSKASGDEAALELAIRLYQDIEGHAYDRKHKGYFEAFDREWNGIADLRLSAKDANERKTMNTHLHIAEAYANLYQAWPDKKLKRQLDNLLEVFAHHIVDSRSFHLKLFFTENWTSRSNIISYGHDIEAAWLLQKVAETIRHRGWTVTMRSLGVKIADAVVSGIDEEGGLMYESENGHHITEKHWWPQAEAMVGFFNAFQVTGDDAYLMRSLQSWDFAEKFIKDHDNGEWFWGVNEDHSIMENKDKAGLWKCPYHNVRACLQIINRIEQVICLQD